MQSPIDPAALLAVHLRLFETERNIYEPAELFDQHRYAPEEYLDELLSPHGSQGLRLENGKLICRATGKEIPAANNVVDLRFSATAENKQWADLNTQFLNYHKSLTAYTLINSMPGINYFAEYSGLAALKNAKVVDVGAGTGHSHCTVFNHPETIEYYLLDPNLRKLHDQFIRLFPRLLKLKIKHLLCHAEFLPLKNELADVVLSYSAIDHYADYKKFIREAHRILRPGGFIVISSHLERPKAGRAQYTPVHRRIFSPTFLERVARYFYYRKFKVGSDDHTFHFHDTSQIAAALKDTGFEIVLDHVFSDNFILKARKIS